MEDVSALRPTLFIAVPRIIERVEDGGELSWALGVGPCACCAAAVLCAVRCAQSKGWRGLPAALRLLRAAGPADPPPRCHLIPAPLRRSDG